MSSQTVLSRIAMFVFLLMSLSIFVSASPVAAPAAVIAAEPGSAPVGSLIARGDVSDQCYSAVNNLDINIDVHITSLNNCYSTNGCDCKPYVDQIVAEIQACVTTIAALEGEIGLNVSLIVGLLVSIITKITTSCGQWVVKLGVTVYLSIFVQIDLILCALIKAIMALYANLIIDLVIALNFKIIFIVKACLFVNVVGLCGL